MSASFHITTSAPSVVKTTRAASLVKLVRGMSDEQIGAELTARRESSYEARIQREAAARRERARKASERLRSL